MGIVRRPAYIGVDRSKGIAAVPAPHCRSLCVAALLAALQFSASAAPAATPDAYDPWPGLVRDIFSNRPMDDATGVLALEMPARAEDAAIVPVTLRVKLPSKHVMEQKFLSEEREGLEGLESPAPSGSHT